MNLPRTAPVPVAPARAFIAALIRVCPKKGCKGCARARKACDSTARSHLTQVSPGGLILTLCGHGEKDPGRSLQDDRNCEKCVAQAIKASGTRCGTEDATEADMGEAGPGIIPSPEPPRSDHLNYQDSGDWE